MKPKARLFRPRAVEFLQFAAFSILLVLACAQPANAQDRRTFALAAGAMTTNGIDVLYNWDELEFAGSYFAGAMVGYERFVYGDRLALGVEFQINSHFGNDSYLEFVLPVTARYFPQNPWISSFNSIAMGLGVSHATSVPQVEIDTRGASQRTLVYLSFELAFDAGTEGQEVFLRVHHRSDGYGVFATDTGSNAFAIGYRSEF